MGEVSTLWAPRVDSSVVGVHRLLIEVRRRRTGCVKEVEDENPREGLVSD